jgi:hypothetical protein
VRDIKTSGGGDRSGLQFIIKDGESAIVRFYGDFESEQDPVIMTEHTINRLQGSAKYQNCGCNAEPEQPCEFCYMRKNGDKDIKTGQKALFRLKDCRKQHKLDNEVRVLKPGAVFVPGKTNPDSDFIKTKYPPCVGASKRCQFCAQKNEAKVVGHRYWKLAAMYADQVVSQSQEVRNYCRCGARGEEGEGTISVDRYLCGNVNCSEPVEFFPESGRPVAKCHSCQQTLPPVEDFSCSSCGQDAQRCGLTDFYFKVTRIGAAGNGPPTYNFEPIHPCKSPTEEELKEAAENVPDFESISRPDPPEMQASVLGVPPHFRSEGHGAQEYDSSPDEPDAQVATEALPGPDDDIPYESPSAKPVARPSPRTAAPKAPAARPAFRLPGR